MKRVSEAPPPQKDRRLVALLALAILLLGVAAGVELCRRLFFKAGPESLAGDYHFKLPPPAPPEAPEAAPEPVGRSRAQPQAREVSAGRFLAVLAKETPRPVAKRFVAAFAGEPELRRVFKEATARGLDQTPARELIGALMKVEAFKSVVLEFRSDPGFRQAFARLASNPEVGGTLRDGTTSLVRAPAGMDLPAAPLRPAKGPEYAAAGPYRGAVPPNTLEDAPPVGRQLRDERRERAHEGDAHNVSPKLRNIDTVKEERNATSYFASAFAGMNQQQLDRLELANDKLSESLTPGGDKVTAVEICNHAGLIEECARACAGSRTCPNEVRRQFSELFPTLF